MITSKKEYQYARESLLRIQVMNDIDEENKKTYLTRMAELERRIEKRLEEAWGIRSQIDALAEDTRKDFE